MSPSATTPEFTSTLDRIADARRRSAELRSPHRTDVSYPPGPPMSQVWRQLLRGEVQSLAFFTGLTTYGPVAHVRLPRADLYFLNDPDLIWEVFVNHSTMKGFGLQAARPIVGDGILTSEGAKHKAHRAMVQPAFTGRQILGYGADMQAAMTDLDGRWLRLHEQGETRIELAHEMSTLTLDIVGRTLFGLDLAAVSDEIGPALSDALEVFNLTMNPKWELLSRYPSRPRRTLARAVDRMDAVVATMIREKRDAVVSGTPKSDIMTALVTARDPDTGAALTDDEIRDEALTLVLAGHETTAMLLTWTWLLLFANPRWKAWVAQEWDAAPALTVSDIPALPRTRAVLAEALRLRPPAWVLDRIALADIDLGEVVIPAGSVMLASQYTMHRDSRFWSDADQFRPDRWLTPEGEYTEKIAPRGAWFPFGFAARKCIGDRFALTEAALALAGIGQKWHVIPTEPGVIEPVPSVTLRPSTTVPARIRPRR